MFNLSPLFFLLLSDFLLVTFSVCFHGQYKLLWYDLLRLWVFFTLCMFHLLVLLTVIYF